MNDCLQRFFEKLEGVQGRVLFVFVLQRSLFSRSGDLHAIMLCKIAILTKHKQRRG